MPSRTFGVPGTAVRGVAVDADSEPNNLPLAVGPGISERVVAEQFSRQAQRVGRRRAAMPVVALAGCRFTCSRGRCSSTPDLRVVTAASGIGPVS